MSTHGTPFELGPRFWSKVDVREQDDCWPWLAFCRPTGYGQFRFEGTQSKAHRLVAGLRTGDPGQALHTCDNPSCCNPAHIYVGTIADNMRDRAARGRTARLCGEDGGNAKLTWASVDRIRATYAAGRTTQRELADEYGVARSTITFVVSGQTWVR